ncbi:MAG: hypothetical protein QOD93_6764, partial [Acetobacteraceae bacterium]|nr:hypothetical protein [Acetobacteraceae bacterium]
MRAIDTVVRRDDTAQRDAGTDRS